MEQLMDLANECVQPKQTVGLSIEGRCVFSRRYRVL